MVINLQDRNLIVNYIQAYLREYFGINLIKVTKRFSYATKDKYEISQNKPIKVSGVYTEETYTAVALFMAFNYPNEQFPERWDLRTPNSTEWIKTPFNSEKLSATMNYLIENNFINNLNEITLEEYNKVVTDFETYFTYDELLKYFESSESLYDILYDKEYPFDKSASKEYTQEDINNNLIVFLMHNLETLPLQSRVAELSERVISYFMEEVVTPSSDSDEILRVQKLMYPSGIIYSKAGEFFEEEKDKSGNIISQSMMQDAKDYQQGFIDRYSTSGKFVPPEGFVGFKVTGYVDPWTEWIIKGGYE